MKCGRDCTDHGPARVFVSLNQTGVGENRAREGGALTAFVPSLVAKCYPGGRYDWESK